MREGLPSLEVLGVRVAQLTHTAALDELVRLHDAPAPAAVGFVNAHTLNLASRDPGFRSLLNGLALVLNDGSGLALAARLQGARFPENLNGTDFTPRVLGLAAARGWGVFLLGARPGVALRAAERLVEQHRGLVIAGVQDGYFPKGSESSVKASIQRSGASVLLVALGNPLQERWLATHLEGTGCRLGLGVGAFLDFAAGEVPRAPAWMRAAGVEWLYRLSLEPGRLWQRYVVGNPAFVARVVSARLRGKT